MPAGGGRPVPLLSFGLLLSLPILICSDIAGRAAGNFISSALYHLALASLKAPEEQF